MRFFQLMFFFFGQTYLFNGTKSINKVKIDGFSFVNLQMQNKVCEHSPKNVYFVLSFRC